MAASETARVFQLSPLPPLGPLTPGYCLFVINVSHLVSNDLLDASKFDVWQILTPFSNFEVINVSHHCFPGLF